MICPHCEKDTAATVPYCQHCGLSVDLTYDKVQASFVDEAARRAERETEERCLGWLLAAAVALAAVLAARWLLVPHAPSYPVLPPLIVSQPAVPGTPPAAGPLEPLPLEMPEIEVPR